MQNPPGARPMELLEFACSAGAAGFSALREGVMTDGPLDESVAELVVIGSLAATAQRSSLAVHVRRALKLGVEPDAIRHAIVVTLGASALFNDVVEALVVVNELAGGDAP